MAKKLRDIIGEATWKGPVDPGTKKVLDAATETPAKTVPGATDDDKLFKATNVAEAPKPGAVTEQVIYEWRDHGPTEGEDRNWKMQAALDQARQYGDMAQRSCSMCAQHERKSTDKNKPAAERNLHNKAKDLQAELMKVYDKLGKHHEGLISDILAGEKK